MVVYIKGKNGRLNSIAAGIADGVSQGAQLGLQLRRQKAQEKRDADEDARYQEARAAAERGLALREQEGAREAESFDIAKKQRAQVEGGSQAISQYELDYQGADEQSVVGAGQGPFADLQAYQANKLGRQKEILKQLPPELHKRHLDTIRAEMEDEQNQALLEHNQTRLEKLSASPMHSEGGELGHMGEQRAARLDELKEIAANAKTPEARAEAVKLIGDAVQKQIMADAVEADRLRTVARTAQAAQQDMATMEQVVAQNRAAGVAPEVLADMEASLGAMGTTLAFYEASNGEMTPQQFSQAWQMARRARAPRAAAGGGGGKGPGDGPKPLTPSDQLSLRKQAIEELPDEQKKDEAAIRAKMSQMQGTDGFSEEAISGALSKAFGSKKPPKDVEAAATSLYEQLSRSGLDPAKVDEQVSEFLRHNGRDPGERGPGGKREEFDPKMGDSVMNKPKAQPKSKPRPVGYRY